MRILLAVATVYAAIAVSVWWLGPWTYEIGPLRASASSVAKPVLVSICATVIALALLPRTRLAARHAWTLSFYVLGAIAMWVLSLGPRMEVMDRPIGYDGPYTWVMLLPGADGLRCRPDSGWWPFCAWPRRGGVRC